MVKSSLLSHSGQWVHYSKHPEVKINPSSMFRDPAGIYLFPKDFKTVGMWNRFPYKFEVELAPDLNVLDFSTLDEQKIRQLTDSMNLPPEQKEHILGFNPEDATDSWWERLTELFSSRKGEFNRLFRDLGYDALFDDTGAIHNSEEQMVLLDPTKIVSYKLVNDRPKGYVTVETVLKKVLNLVQGYGTITIWGPKKYKKYGEEEIRAEVRIESGKDHCSWQIQTQTYKGEAYPNGISVSLGWDSANLSWKEGRSHGGTLDFMDLEKRMPELEKEIESTMGKIFGEKKAASALGDITLPFTPPEGWWGYPFGTDNPYQDSHPMQKDEDTRNALFSSMVESREIKVGEVSNTDKFFNYWFRQYGDSEGLDAYYAYDESDDEELSPKRKKEKARKWFDKRLLHIKKMVDKNRKGNKIHIYRCMKVPSDWLEKLKNNEIKKLGMHWTLSRDLAPFLCEGTGGKMESGNIIMEAEVNIPDLSFETAFNPNWADELGEEYEVQPDKVNLLKVWDHTMLTVLYEPPKAKKMEALAPSPEYGTGRQGQHTDPGLYRFADHPMNNPENPGNFIDFKTPQDDWNPIAEHPQGDLFDDYGYKDAMWADGPNDPARLAHDKWAFSKKSEMEPPEAIRAYIEGEQGLPSLKDKEVKKYHKWLQTILPAEEYKLYRGFGIGGPIDESADDIFADDPMSFTENKSTALSFAKDAGESGDDYYGYVVSVHVPKDCIYFHWKYGGELGRSHPKEKEVLAAVRHYSYQIEKVFKPKTTGKKSQSGWSIWEADPVYLEGHPMDFPDVGVQNTGMPINPKGVRWENGRDTQELDPKVPINAGARGDWKKEGYTLSAEKIPKNSGDYGLGGIIIRAKDPAGKEVGTAEFHIQDSNQLFPRDVDIEKLHRRKGLANAMYLLAEEITKRNIRSSGDQTSPAKKLWSQPNRPFGASIAQNSVLASQKTEAETFEVEAVEGYPSEKMDLHAAAEYLLRDVKDFKFDRYETMDPRDVLVDGSNWMDPKQVLRRSFGWAKGMDRAELVKQLNYYTKRDIYDRLLSEKELSPVILVEDYEFGLTLADGWGRAILQYALGEPIKVARYHTEKPISAAVTAAQTPQWLTQPTAWNGKSQLKSAIMIGGKTYQVQGTPYEWVMKYQNFPDPDKKKALEDAGILTPEYFEEYRPLIVEDLSFTFYDFNQPGEEAFQDLVLKVLLNRKPLPTKFDYNQLNPAKNKTVQVTDFMKRGKLALSAEEVIESALKVELHTVMINSENCIPVLDDYFDEIQALIPEDSVHTEHPYQTDFPDGREQHPHTTVFYGIKNSEDLEPIREHCKDLPPVHFTIGNISAFRNEDMPYDVLKVEVFSDDMKEIHYWIKDNFETKTDFEFNGHITLAYIKKDTCHELEGPCAWTGKDYICDLLTFSDKDLGFKDIPMKSEVVEAGIVNQEDQHLRNTCPKCGGITQCKCIDGWCTKIETNNICSFCKVASEFHDEGHVGSHWGSQASGCMFRCGDKILLLKRAAWTMDPLLWGIPGGAVPVNEQGKPMDVRESAQKETTEEIGRFPLDCKWTEQAVYRDGTFKYTTFLIDVPEEFTPTLNDEHTDFQWVPVTELPKKIHPGVRWALKNF